MKRAKPESPPARRRRQSTSVFFGLVVLGTLLLVVRPLLAPTVLAVLAAVVGAPLHRRVERLLGAGTDRAAIVSLLLFCIFLAGPFLGVTALLLVQAQRVLVQFIGMPEGMTLSSRIFKLADELLVWLQQVGSSYLHSTVDLEVIARERLHSAAAALYGALPGLVEGVVHFAFAFLVFAVALYFLFRDGTRIVQIAVDLSPLGEQSSRQLLGRMSQTLRAVVLGGVMTAVFQSLIGGLGFWLAGFQNFAIWGAMIFVASFVPVFGTALVWVPAALFLSVTDSPGSAAFLVGVGVVISTTDNLFRLILIGRRATLHPLLLFFGVFGGLAAVGPMGLIYGLLLVSALAEAVQIYREQTVGLPPDPA